MPLGAVVALVLLPSRGASHLSMDMPGLGGAVLPPPSFGLLAVTTLAALLEGAWLVRSARTRRWEAGWAFALLPFAVSGARALALAPAGALGARITAVGSIGAEHMWALLASLALVVGLGAARVLEEGLARWSTRTREAPRLAAALGVLVLASPLVGLIVGSSTGIDWVSSWLRWGGVGLAAIVCAGGALVPGRGASRAAGGITFVTAVGLALLAEREYVEALAHDALARGALAQGALASETAWVRGLREIAAAVEPRERYGLVAALLPCAVLVPRRGSPQLRREVGAGVALLAGAALVATTISMRLDEAARAAAAVDALVTLAPTQEGDVASEPAAELRRWSARVLPRTVPWVHALGRARPEQPPTLVPVRCAVWTAPTQPPG